MSRAIVTGAGGFIGANLVRRLMADGDDVVAFVRPGADEWRLADIDVAQIEVDLRDGDAVARAVGSVAPTRVFHLAAHGAYSWQRDAREMIAVNVAGTSALLDALAGRGDAVVVHAGTSSEYGFKDSPPAEDALLEPNSRYAVTKAAATHLCALAHVPTATLRLYSAYGPWEDRRRLVPQLVEHAMSGSLPPLVSDAIARDFVFVDDVCEAFVLAASRLEAGADVGVLNVGAGRQVPLRELVAIAREVWGVRVEPAWGSMEARDWDTTSWCSDPSAAAERLGWSAVTPLDEGLRLTGDWLQTQVAA